MMQLRECSTRWINNIIYGTKPYGIFQVEKIKPLTKVQYERIFYRPWYKQIAIH